MVDRLVMSKKERQRKSILDQVIEGVMRPVDGSRRLGISSRQFRRIVLRYKAEGDIGLIHGNRGRAPGCAYSSEKKSKILERYKARYLEFGPTFASEKLLEADGLRVSPETLRLWLRAENLWGPHRRRKSHRTRRARRSRFGELLQMDGSIHGWFTGCDEKQCLMNMVDDATGKTLALMDAGETTRAAFSVLKWWIQEAGIPLAIYVDLKSLYVSPKLLRASADEELVEAEWLTHFSKACKKLGITIIKAYSPQAKGRVERNHAVYQDRLVKELKLNKINTIEKANEFLSAGFINRLNEKFAKPAIEPEDAHVVLSAEDDLDQVFCWEFIRQVKNDWTFQLRGQHYQIEKDKVIRPKQKVLVRRHLDESLSLWYRGKSLAFHAIEARATVQKAEKKGLDPVAHSRICRANKHKSPWNAFRPGWLASKKVKKMGKTSSSRSFP